jgi:hypothetical protein
MRRAFSPEIAVVPPIRRSRLGLSVSVSSSAMAPFAAGASGGFPAETGSEANFWTGWLAPALEMFTLRSHY